MTRPRKPAKGQHRHSWKRQALDAARCRTCGETAWREERRPGHWGPWHIDPPDVRAALLNACREAEALLTIVPPRYGRKHTLETLAVLRAALALSRERRR